jgi:molecular chaperone DnaK
VSLEPSARHDGADAELREEFVDKIVGIDLGTTNSCAAVVVNDRPVVIPNALGERITPSVVRLLENGEAIVGRDALLTQSLDPHNTITGIKRFMGRRFNEVFDLAQTAPFTVAPGPNNIAAVLAHGRLYPPQVIAALILKSLKNSAEAFLNEKVNRAVITVPAYFSESQWEATREAAALAGFDTKWEIEDPKTGKKTKQRMRIINEPTAASLAYGFEKKERAIIAVLDLGGGTFDVTVLDLGDGVFEVKAIAGDGFLGGDDFDSHLVEWLVEEIYRQHRLDVSGDRQTVTRILEAAVAAKCHLSEHSEARIQVPHLIRVQDQFVALDRVLPLDHFNDLCEELFYRLAQPCGQVLKDTGYRPTDLDYVLLVGGATRMQRVAGIAREIFGKEPSRGINPDEAVALGAAVQGHQLLLGSHSEVMLLDVTSHSFGIETMDGRMRKLIERNTTIPKKAQDIFSTSVEGQTSVEIHVLEGEGETALENRSLGWLVLDGIRPAPRGVAQIEVTFDIDANRQLEVTARDRDAQKETRLTLKASSGLPQAELTAWQTALPSLRHS